MNSSEIVTVTLTRKQADTLAALLNAALSAKPTKPTAAERREQRKQQIYTRAQNALAKTLGKRN